MTPALHYGMLRLDELWRTRRAHMDDRGDAYTGTIMIAIGVIIAISVGGILLAKFTQKADDIDVSTPDTVVVAPPPVP